MDLMPSRASWRMHPVSGFQGTMGFVGWFHLFFKALLATTAWRVSVLGWATPADRTFSWGLHAPLWRQPALGCLSHLQPACVWLSVGVSGSLCVDKLYLTPEKQCLSPGQPSYRTLTRFPGWFSGGNIFQSLQQCCI